MNHISDEEIRFTSPLQTQGNSPLQNNIGKEIVNNIQDEENKNDNPIGDLKNFYEKSKKRRTKHFLHIEDAYPGSRAAFVIATSDNKYIITNCAFTIKVFHFQTGELLHHFSPVHQEAICSIIVTSENRFLISGARDGSVERFDLYTGEKVPQQDWIRSRAVAPNKRLMAYACDENDFIQVINLETGEKVQHIQNPGKGDNFEKVIVTPDEKYIAFASSWEGTKGSIRLFNVGDGKEVYHLRNAHEKSTDSLIVTSDSRYLVSAALKEKSIKVIDLKNREPIYHFKNVHKNSIRSVITSGDRLLISMSKWFIKIFDLHKGEEVHHFQNIHKRILTSVAMTSGDRYLISGFQDGSIKVFDLNTNEEVHYLQDVHNKQINSVLVTIDNGYILSTSWDSSIKLFDLGAGELGERDLNVYRRKKSPMIITPNNEWIIFASQEQDINIFDIHTGEEVHCFEGVSDRNIDLLTVTSDNKYLISASSSSDCEGYIEIFDLEDKTRKKCFENAYHTIYSLTLTSGNKYILAADVNDSVNVFDMCNEKELDLIEEVRRMILTPDSQHLISWSPQGLIQVVDLKNLEAEKRKEKKKEELKEEEEKEEKEGEEKEKEKKKGEGLAPEDSERNDISLMAVTSNNQLLILGLRDGFIDLFDLKIQKEVYRFERVHRSPIQFLVVTSDDKFLLSAGKNECSITVFDLYTKQQVHCFENIHKYEISSMILTSDDRFLISADGREGLIRIFDFRTKQQVHYFDNSDQDFIDSMIVTSDNKYIISGSRKIKVFDFCEKKGDKSEPKQDIISNSREEPFPLRILDQPFYFVSDEMKQFSIFNSMESFLFDRPVEESILRAKKQPRLFVFPYYWTILHIVSVYENHHFIEKMPNYSQFKMPFLLDAFNNTPFHYLIAQKNVNIETSNILFSYLCDYLDDCCLRSPFEFQKIIESLSTLIPFILERIEFKTRHRFLTIIYAESPVSHRSSAPVFGKNLSKSAAFRDSPVLTQETKEKIWNNKGAIQVKFRSNFLYLDYNILSQDMNNIINCLKDQEGENFFKIASIIGMINHLWEQAKQPLIIISAFNSTFIAGLSVFLALERRCLPCEAALLAISVLLTGNELWQAYHLKLNYLKNSWNWIDSIHLLLTMAFLSFRMHENDNKLAKAWLSSLIIIFGCLRCISILKIFEPTRNLIQAIITSIKDMMSFVIIIALIIVAISVVILLFDIENNYGDSFYKAYNVLYADMEIGEDEEVFGFFLSVVLLNLLIAIMYASHDEVLKMRKRTDSLTRLAMISEAVVYIKLWKKLKSLFPTKFREMLSKVRICKRFQKPDHPAQKGYLVYCLPFELKEDDEENQELKKKIKTVKKLIQTMNHKLSSLEENNRTMKLSSNGSNEARKDEISTMNEKRPVAMKNEKLDVKEDILTLQHEVTIVKNELSNVKTDISDLKEIILSEFSKLKTSGYYPTGDFLKREIHNNPSATLKKNLIDDFPAKKIDNNTS